MLDGATVVKAGRVEFSGPPHASNRALCRICYAPSIARLSAAGPAIVGAAAPFDPAVFPARDWPSLIAKTRFMELHRAAKVTEASHRLASQHSIA